MSLASARSAARDFNRDALALAQSSPGTFARDHQIEVAEAIPIISREATLRKSHKMWRK